MVSDSERGVLFMFGGERHNFNHDMSMWLYSLSTNVWSKGATAPEPRSGHNMAKLNSAVMVFGGYTGGYHGSLSKTLTNRLLSYDISNDIWEDTRASNPPSSRAYAALAAFEEQELLLLFGGLRCGIRDHPCDPPWATCGRTARPAIAGSNSSQMAPSQHHGIWPAVLPTRAGLSSSAVGALLPNILLTCGTMTSRVIRGLSSPGGLTHGAGL